SEHVFDEIVAKPQKQNMSGLVRSINHEIETTKTEIFNDAQAFVLDLGTYSSETSAAEPVEKMGSAYALESLLDENVKQDSKIENTPFQSVGRLKMPDVIFEPVVNLYPNYTPIQPVSNARYSIGFNVKSGISFTKDRNIVSENSDRTFFSPQPLESMLISIALRRKLHPSWSVGIGGQYVGLVSRVNVNNIEKIFENEPAVVAYLYQSNGNITSTQGQSIKTTIRTTHGNVYNYDISWEATASLGWHSKVKSWNCDVYSTIGFPLFQSHKGSSLLGEKYSIYQPRTVDFDKNFSIQVSSNVSRDWRFGRLGLGIGMYYRSSHFWLDQQALTRTWISPMMGISYQYKLY
ncbi:MAG: hypothetical protein KDC04_08935, partial [Saprospiraceae bacterium]|nr:hypothetical protein [Saprospiraceae bacterium]